MPAAEELLALLQGKLISTSYSRSLSERNVTPPVVTTAEVVGGGVGSVRAV